MEIAEGLLTIFTDHYFEKEKNDDQRFLCISGSICCWVLNRIYETLLENKEIDSIFEITKEKKEKYWDLAKRYNSKKEEWTMAAKSTYVLELITSTF